MAKLVEVQTVFTLAGWDEKPYDESDGIKLTKARFAKNYEGDIAGTSVTESLMVYRPDGSASFVGIERFVGTIQGKRGTLVIQSEGEFRGGVVESRGLVVAGAGTSELAAVTGEVPYKSGESSAYPMTFRLDLG